MRVRALYDQVLFKEETNPFVKLKTESGLFIPEGISFTNETGDMEKMDKIIGFGIVVEAGGECKYLKAGDAIFYDRRSIRAVPAGEVLWNMSERGMVGYVPSEDPDLQAAFVSYYAKVAEIDKQLQENSELEKQLALDKVAEYDEAAYKSSPLIKIK